MNQSRLLGLLLLLVFSSTLEAQDFSLNKGDHVVYIGNTLADRMQHHAWLETYLHAIHPEHQLTFRNLGFSGDEVNLRQRAENFGAPDLWLAKCKADVVFCFFGYNEALKGDANLPQFTTDLGNMIDHMRSQKYNGASAPQLVVFSPIAHEDLRSPNLPDGRENNQKLAKYTEAMRRVCAEKQVRFVDLFAISKSLYAEAKQPLTMNGIHLLERGNRELARAVLAELLSSEAIPVDEAVAELRKAVLDKNYHWFSRYRVVDEYNVFGGRSKLAWFGQSNADVMMREMEIFDVKTENRDKKIWAAAAGREYEIKDDNLPAELTVKPNREGPLTGGAFPYLSGEEGISKMKVQEGLQVNLFASEEQFPRLINPVQMAVDTDGRLWASVWPSYPHWNPTEPRKDALVILPDDNNDGKADRLTVFADELNSVTGFEFWGGGVLVAAPPEIWFLKDTDGDDKADLKIRMLQGVSSADTHHSANAMLIGPDGWLYWSRGIFNVAAFETPTTTFRSGQSGVYRFNPRTYEIEFHYPIGPNPHGDVFDRWGFQFANDGTSGTGGYVSLGKGLRPGNRQWFKKEWRPVAATGILSSSHFPDSFQNNFLICNTIGFLGVLQYEVGYNGAEISATRTTDLLQSSDENFRPSDIEVGGDGAIYVSDWHNVLIGHMQHNMRDPNRDHAHGRIYRISAQGREPLAPVKMKGKPIAEVLENFFSRENGTRYRARLELSGRETSDVVEAVAAFTAKLDPSKVSSGRDEAQALLECLWVHEEHRVPNLTLLKKVFGAEEPRVRAAAIRTLGHWAQRVSEWEPLLNAAAHDSSALVRAEAAKAAVEFGGLSATEAIFAVATSETDPELDDVLAFARQQINVDAMIADAIKSGKSLSKGAEAYALQNADAKLLLQMQRSPAVYGALLSRAGIPAPERWQALRAVAAEHSRAEFQQLLYSIHDAETNGHNSLKDLAGLLASAEPQLLKGQAGALKDLAERTKSSDVRRDTYTAWLRAGDAKSALTHAMQSRAALSDALAGLRAINDPQTLETLYPVIRPLMFELPAAIRSAEDDMPGAGGPPVSFEYYEPNPKDVAMETLDNIKPNKVGVMPGFATYVPGGKQDGFATRQVASLVVPAAGKYAFYLASDDGSRLYIDKREVINNDGLHGMVERSGELQLDAGLHEISVHYFDNGGGDGLRVEWDGPGLRRQAITPDMLRPRAGGNLRQQALQLLAGWPGHLPEKIRDFAQLAADKALSAPALSALAGLPGRPVRDTLSAAEAEGILQVAMQLAERATPAERQGKAFSDLLSLGGTLAVKLDSREQTELKLAALKASIPVKADPKVMALGMDVYSRESHCATCHQPHGQGLPNLYPPLDGSIWATGSEERMIRMVLDGMHGTIEVKGRRYSSPPLPPMTGFRQLLNDEEIAAVLTYVRNSWTNRAKPVEARDVTRIRAIDRGADAAFWHANELLALYPLEDGSKPIESTTDGWVPKFVKTWKVEDFTSTQLESGKRNYETGKLMFQRVGCAQCHKLGDVGGVFGPDLAKLDDKKRNAAYVLQAIIDPSKDIDQKYAMHTYRLESGKVVSGLIVKETTDEVHLVSDPLNRDRPTIIVKDEIQAEAKTVKSIMPLGLLNWLKQEEVLDVIAFVLAGGDQGNPIYNR